MRSKFLFAQIFPWLIAIACCTQTWAILTPQDEIFNGKAEADRYDWTLHPCRRTCDPYEPPKTCYYVFVVETYTTMSKACYDCPYNLADCYRPHCVPADGVQRIIYTVNRQLPGPSIEVCVDDVIIVDVRNRMRSESTTIHWNGLRQVGTPWMDGAPYVTQCPILPGQSFRYEFVAADEGTHVWHSHIASQRVDGMFGALIVRPKLSPNYLKSFYDHDDNLMVVNDWSHTQGTPRDVVAFHYRNKAHQDTILINGMGRDGNFQTDRSVPLTPLAVFTVSQNKRHRFRMIHAAEDCSIEMSIDDHTMLVISLDGNDIQPVEVDAVITWAGERVDFILTANRRPGNYWIRYRGYGSCGPDYKPGGTFGVAVLRYDSVAIKEPLSPIGYNVTLRTPNTRSDPSGGIDIHIPMLNAFVPDDKSLSETVDQRFYINFDFYPKNNYDYHREGLYSYDQVPRHQTMGTMQLNHLSLKLPSFPLLTQPELIKPETLCNSSSVPYSCREDFCGCTRVESVGLGSVVELVLIDEGNYPTNVVHPLHLHGHNFRVVAQADLEGPVSIERFKRLDREGRIFRKLNRAPIKSTVSTPTGGYTVLRFHADNPGYWLFHCQLEQHSTGGMGLIFRIGEHWQFTKKPSSPNFPSCGDYLPPPRHLGIPAPRPQAFRRVNSGYYV